MHPDHDVAVQVVKEPDVVLLVIVSALGLRVQLEPLAPERQLEILAERVFPGAHRHGHQPEMLLAVLAIVPHADASPIVVTGPILRLFWEVLGPGGRRLKDDSEAGVVVDVRAVMLMHVPVASIGVADEVGALADVLDVLAEGKVLVHAPVWVGVLVVELDGDETGFRAWNLGGSTSDRVEDNDVLVRVWVEEIEAPVNVRFPLLCLRPVTVHGLVVLGVVDGMDHLHDLSGSVLLSPLNHLGLD